MRSADPCRNARSAMPHPAGTSPGVPTRRVSGTRWRCASDGARGTPAASHHHLQPVSVTASSASAGIASRPMPECAFRQSARLAFDMVRASVDVAVSARAGVTPDDAPIAPIAAVAAACRNGRAAPSESRSARQSAATPGARGSLRCASPASALACASLRGSRMGSDTAGMPGARRDEGSRSRAATCTLPIDARGAGPAAPTAARAPSSAPTPAPIKAKAMASANALSIPLSIPLSTPMAAPKPIAESTSRRAPASPGAAHRAPRPCLPAVPSARSRATRARESPRRPSARARRPRSADIPAPSARTRAAAPARPRAPPRPRASRRPPARRVTAHRRPARPRTRADRPAGNRGAGRSPRASRSECL